MNTKLQVFTALLPTSMLLQLQTDVCGVQTDGETKVWLRRLDPNQSSNSVFTSRVLLPLKH